MDEVKKQHRIFVEISQNASHNVILKSSERIAHKALVRCGVLHDIPFPLPKTDTLFQRLIRLFSLN